MNWRWTGINRKAGGIPSRFIRKVIVTAGAVKAVCTPAASGTTNKKTPV
jgi:hypothetical protein